jgi:hypothetical protein
LVAVIVMVEMAEVPALTGAGEEADALKSQNWKRADAEWAREPLVPDNVRV